MFEQLTTSEIIALVSTILLFLSEVLPFTSKIRSNGIFEAVVSILGYFKKK